MLQNTIKCELCGKICSTQVSHDHLRKVHQMTTKEYRALGYKTLSPARLEQLLQSPVGSGRLGREHDQWGPNHWNWKGGHLSGSGYKIIRKVGRKGVLEHRVVAEQMLGRPLLKDEVVHHIDGNRLNNDPANLQVMTKKAHDNLLPSAARRHHDIHPETIQAASILHEHGWNVAMIARAIRVESRHVLKWIDAHNNPSDDDH